MSTRAITASASVAEKYLDLAALWRIAGDAGPLKSMQGSAVPTVDANRPTVGVIRDKAFQSIIRII